MKLLAIGAHLDDFELACGGTMAKAVENGHQVKAVVLSKSGYKNYDGRVMRSDETAEREGREAADILGIKDLTVLDFENKNIQYHYSIIEMLNQIIDEYNPDVVFMHHVFDTHQSHEGAAKSTLSAARRKNDIFMFEPIVPSGRSYMAFRPQLYIGFDEKIMEKKIEAMKAHRTEYNKFGETWIDGVKARAAYRGYEMGAKYAEAFEVIRCTMGGLGWEL